MGVVIVVVFVEAKACCLNINGIIYVNQLNLEELWNVDENGKKECWEYKSQQVHQWRIANFVPSVKKWSANDEIPIRSNAHYQESFTGKHNVLDWIVEVGEDIDEHDIVNTNSGINHDKDKQKNVAERKSQ